MSMSESEAGQVVAALRKGRELKLGNSMYGTWGLAWDAPKSVFHYHSEFWGDDPRNPDITDEWLDEAALVAKLVATYDFEPHLAEFARR